MSAPRYFPDMPLSFAGYLLHPDIAGSLFIASCLLILLQFFSVSLVCRTALSSWPLSFLSGVLYLSACVLLGTDLTSYSYISWHVGTFSIIMICLALIISLERRLYYVALLLVFTAATIASNFIALPLILTGTSGIVLATFFIEKKITLRAITPLIYVAIGCGAGTIIYYFLTPYPFTNPVHSSDLSLRATFNLTHLINSGVHTVGELSMNPIFLSALVSGLVCLWLFKNSVSYQPILLIFSFWLLAALCNEGLISLGARDINRYQIMQINGSIAMTSIFAVLIISRYKISYWLPFLSIIPIIIFRAPLEKDQFREAYHQQIEQVNCISEKVEQLNLHTGVSDLHTIHPYSVLSSGRIELLGIRGTSKAVPAFMLPFPLLDTTIDYAIANIDHNPAHYLRKTASYPLSEKLALSFLGAPAQRYVCGSKVLLTYPSGISLSRPKLQ